MRDDVRKNLDEHRVKLTAREILLPLFETKPILERLAPMYHELLWVLLGKQNPQEHKFTLPAYCYNIFDKVGRTVFQAFPSLQDTVFLNCQTHDVPILVAARLLKPLGNPAANAIKFFASAELREQAEDRTWLVRVTNAVNQHWQKNNSFKRKVISPKVCGVDYGEGQMA